MPSRLCETAGMQCRLSLIALVAVVAVLVPAPASAGESPIHPDNKPTPVEGHENGRLPPELLINVAPGCEAHRDAAPSLGLLMAMARHEAVALGTRECYRPIDEQVAVRQQWTSRGNSACAAPVKRDADGRAVGTSNHGWGKAGDFSDARGSLTFSSDGYALLKRHAGRVGWNHPGWAEPGGSACPEAWHWEWVGDGGTMGADPIRADVVAGIPRSDAGYSGVTGLGALAHRGAAVDHGDASEVPLSWLVVDASPMPAAAGDGYWLVASDGGVFSYGDARFHGSLGDVDLQRPVVGMAATPTGRGYWLVASDGGVFAFGDAIYHGSLGGAPPSRPVVTVAATPDGGGYWLAGDDGAVHAFGSADDFGSMAGQPLALPVVDVATTRAGDGYWLVAADGGVFAFGGARYLGGV